MFEVISTLHITSLDSATSFSHLQSSWLSDLTSESHLKAVREAMVADLPNEVVCGRWVCDMGLGRNRQFRGGRRVDQALVELEEAGYRPVPLVASVYSELWKLIPHENLYRHVCLQKLFPALPDPRHMTHSAAALQELMNTIAGEDHYSCLYFESSVINGRRRSACIFGRETLLEIVPGSIVLVVPAS